MRRISYSELCGAGFVLSSQTALTGECVITMYCSYAPTIAGVLVFSRLETTVTMPDYIDRFISPEQALVVDALMIRAQGALERMLAEPFEEKHRRLRALTATMPYLFSDVCVRAVYVHMLNDHDKFKQIVENCLTRDNAPEEVVKFFSNETHRLIMGNPTTLPKTPSCVAITPERVHAAIAIINANAQF